MFRKQYGKSGIHNQRQLIEKWLTTGGSQPNIGSNEYSESIAPMSAALLESHFSPLPPESDPVVAGVDTFLEVLGLDPSASPYSLFSKKYPILSLVKEHLDAPLFTFLERHAHLLKSVADLEPFILSDLLERARINRRPFEVVWGEFFERRIRRLLDNDNGQGKSVGRTLERLRFVIEICWTTRPKRVTWGAIKYSVKGSVMTAPVKGSVVTASVQRSGANFQHGFCELCWRYSEVEDYKRNGGECRFVDISLGGREKIGVPSRDVLKKQKNRLSYRFCKDHRATGSNKTYRTAHTYKKQFQQEVVRLQNYYSFSEEQEGIRSAAWAHVRENSSPSGEIELATFLEVSVLSGIPSEEEIRKEAYNNVRRQFSKSGEIIQLYREGVKQSEIAKQLGITRQAVSKVIKREERKHTAFLELPTRLMVNKG